METNENETKTKPRTTLSLVYNITADDVETPKNKRGGQKRGITTNYENIRKRDENAKFSKHAKYRASVRAMPVRDTSEDLLDQTTSLPGSIPGGHIVERRVCSCVQVSSV